MARVINVRFVEREGQFFRCGHRWVPEGEDVSEGAFTEEEWARLAAEPRLVLKEATDAADDALDAPDAVEISEAIGQAILSLDADGFTDKGAAKVAAVKAAVAEAYRDHVNAKAVGEAQGTMVAEGWTAPQKDAG